MTLRPSCLAIAVVLAFLVLLPGCHKPPVAVSPPLTINLAYNNGQCTQNGSAGVINVFQDQSVTYQGANVLNQFNIQFSTCPFASANCPVNSPQGTSQTPGAPTAANANQTYYYSSVTINNQTCSNGPGSFGIHIKPIGNTP